MKGNTVRANRAICVDETRYSTISRIVTTALLMLIVGGLTPQFARAWEPNADDQMQLNAAAEVADMLRRKPELQRYFDEAYAYAIYPRVLRAAIGFGVVYGRGLLIEQDRLAGETSQMQGTLGMTLGGQMHSQIIFFRDAEILKEFKTGRFEFQGRASAVLIAVGAAMDPGFKSQVAIFTRTRGGLMIELDAAVAKFSYTPTEGD
jgi:lipid-binding SYLF domain-containing protein